MTSLEMACMCIFLVERVLPMIPSRLHCSNCPLRTSRKRKGYHCHLWGCQARLVIADLMLAICYQCGAWEEAPGDFSERNFFHKLADYYTF